MGNAQDQRKWLGPVGLIPVIGAPFAIADGVIAATQGDGVDAALGIGGGILSLVPGVGSVASATRTVAVSATRTAATGAARTARGMGMGRRGARMAKTVTVERGASRVKRIAASNEGRAALASTGLAIGCGLAKNYRSSRPGGSWSKSAKNVTYEDGLLTADLRMINGRYRRTSINARKHEQLENIDGHFRKIR